MMLKYFGTLLFMMMITVSLADEFIKITSLSKTEIRSVVKETNKHEIYLEDGVELSCGESSDKSAGDSEGLKRLATVPKPGWFCKNGYARNSEGKCVKLVKCSSKFFFII